VIDLLVELGILAATTAGAVWVTMRTRAGRLIAWRAAAQQSGLTVVEVDVRACCLVAQTGALEVSFRRPPVRKDLGVVLAEAIHRSTPSPGTLITIKGLAPALGLAPERGAPVLGRGGQGDLQLGDPTFDSAVFVQGPPALLFALLDAPTRRQAVQAMVWDVVVVAGGQLRVRLPESSATLLPTMLRPLLVLAERLRQPADIAAVLAAHVRDETMAEVRRLNLLALAREYPEHAATRDALRHALSDDDDEIRLRAALMLGPEGLPVLREMALRETGDESCTARAVEALGPELGGETAHALLARALRERRHLLARAAMVVLARVGDTEALRTLSRILAVEKGDLAEAAAVALGGSNRAAAEAPLVAALDHATDFVRQAAAQGLGRVGSIAAVLPLREAEEGYPGDTALRRAAREAVAAIQARSGEASPGRLTLAEGESGRLSLTEGNEGRLSLAEPSRARR